MILHKPDLPGVAIRNVSQQDHGLEHALDITKLLDIAKPALEKQEKVRAELEIQNVNRTVGAILSSEVALRYGHAGLPDDTIHLKFKGSAGQSFGAFAARGMTMELEGDANDYCASAAGA